MLVVAPSYTGSAADPEEIAALRSVPGLVSDSVRSQPFLDQQRLFDSPYGETATTGRAISSARFRTS